MGRHAHGTRRAGPHGRRRHLPQPGRAPGRGGARRGEGPRAPVPRRAPRVLHLEPARPLPGARGRRGARARRRVLARGPDPARRRAEGGRPHRRRRRAPRRDLPPGHRGRQRPRPGCAARAHGGRDHRGAGRGLAHVVRLLRAGAP
ncbi:MAG TPA: hypothetical protein PLH84_14305 [Candidatus Krumholzibacteria bacterium]|nr:hypothetical protein [Candidatus Krumholzibacteria bacterium]